MGTAVETAGMLCVLPWTAGQQLGRAFNRTRGEQGISKAGLLHVGVRALRAAAEQVGMLLGRVAAWEVGLMLGRAAPMHMGLGVLLGAGVKGGKADSTPHVTLTVLLLLRGRQLPPRVVVTDTSIWWLLGYKHVEPSIAVWAGAPPLHGLHALHGLARIEQHAISRPSLHGLHELHVLGTILHHQLLLVLLLLHRG